MTTILDPDVDDPFEKLLVGYIDWFEVHDRDHLEAVLEKMSGVEKIEDGEWEWREGVGAECRVVAELGFEGEGFAVFAKQEVDADRCSSRLRAAAGRAVAYLIGEERFEMRRKEVPSPAGGSGTVS